ncbi:ribosomal protein S6 modification protein [Pyrococcus sp. NA2]|uniref:lysine biosynthesis protein LysX n=1 Tax=Pyrococcus sp. (strain NA2) TaxID=342949 RepID=UPI000209A8F9|nr:lysine biosynthesis protein LysX [Pyrococcus sp. NA2]AEC51247.1 ribosomal protein S6 modification protein [Pyrococcus sp. NA2]
MRIGVTYTILRKEELMIRDRAREYGEVVMLHEDDLTFPKKYDLDVAIIRNISHYKALYIAKLLEEQGTPTVNSFNLMLEAGDKVFATLKLAKKVPVPRWRVSFSEKSAKKIPEELGYPLVSKPVFGSWGRLLAKINDEDSLENVLEHKKWMKNPLYNIHYFQEFIDKPGRDIRSYVIGGEFVTAIYRYSDHWITNTARGGRAEPCDREDVVEISIKAWEAFGEGALAIDIFEGKNGLLVNEVNPNMEFKNAARVTGVDIARKLVEYAVEVAKR